MRTLIAAMAAFCFFGNVPVHAGGPNSGPDSMFTGEGGRYVSPENFTPARPHARKRAARSRHPARAIHRRAHAAPAARAAQKKPAAVPSIGVSLIASMRADIGRNPTGWRRQWCGKYLAMKTCQRDGRLNLARNWRYEGTAAPWGAVGSVAVLPHHVGVVTGRCGDGSIKMVSGNFGARGVDEGCVQGPFLAFRWVQGCGWTSTKPDDALAAIAPAAVPAESGAHQKAESGEFVSLGPLRIAKPEPLRESDKAAIFERDADYHYLCTAYLREPKKEDRSGDFTWKDIAAAKRKGMGLCEFAIGGMNPKLRHAVANTGRAIDAALPQIKWTLLSAFRDDYRQGIASGFKARTGFSLHGGSRVTGGYGDGRAIDVTIAGGLEDAPARAGALFAKFGRKFGLVQPMPRRDAAHIQLGGTRLAKVSRQQRWARHGTRSHYAAR